MTTMTDFKRWALAALILIAAGAARAQQTDGMAPDTAQRAEAILVLGIVGKIHRADEIGDRNGFAQGFGRGAQGQGGLRLFRRGGPGRHQRGLAVGRGHRGVAVAVRGEGGDGRIGHAVGDRRGRRGFWRAGGLEVRLEADRLVEGRRRFRGRIAGTEGQDVAIDLEGEDETALIPFAWLAEAKLVLNDELMKLGAAKRPAETLTEED